MDIEPSFLSFVLLFISSFIFLSKHLHLKSKIQRQKISGTDPEATIVGAFQMFDKKDCGRLTEEELLKILQNKRGEPLDDDEIKAMYKVILHSIKLRLAKIHICLK